MRLQLIKAKGVDVGVKIIAESDGEQELLACVRFCHPVMVADEEFRSLVMCPNLPSRLFEPSELTAGGSRV